MSSTDRDKALNELVERLFTNGGGHKADRLLLVKEDYRCSAHVTRALDLGGYSREVVRDVLATALADARAEVWKEAIQIVKASHERLDVLNCEAAEPMRAVVAALERAAEGGSDE